MNQIGEYRIIKKIGEGSFGQTFLAEHVALGIPVCIKREKPLKQRPAVDLFHQEALILSHLRFPYLPAFMGYMELPDPVGRVMILSFAEGDNLDSAVKTTTLPDGTVKARRPIDDEHICWILDRILGALSYLHGRWEIVHCDMKPGNVILDIPNHEVTVVDFGMAALRPVEWSKSKGGTPGYMPPESATGFPPIPASDIYGAGKIVCHISGGDVMRGVFPDDMDPRLREFFEPWIRHDPMQRPEHAGNLRIELAELRKKVFGRSASEESFKYRDGTGG